MNNKSYLTFCRKKNPRGRVVEYIGPSFLFFFDCALLTDILLVSVSCV